MPVDESLAPHDMPLERLEPPVHEEIGQSIKDEIEDDAQHHRSMSDSVENYMQIIIFRWFV